MMLSRDAKRPSLPLRFAQGFGSLRVTIFLDIVKAPEGR